MSTATQPVLPANSSSDQLVQPIKSPSSSRWRRKRGLLGLIEDQTALMVENARMLCTGLSEPGFARIDGLYEEAQKTERVLVQKLEATLITPIDAEDMYLVSNQIRRVVQLQSFFARSFTGLGDGLKIPNLAQGSLQCAEAIAGAVRCLPEDDGLLVFTADAVTHARSAGKLARNWENDLLSGSEFPVTMRVMEFLSVQTELFGSYRRTARSLERTLFKNT